MKKIGIITMYYKSLNCGGNLQAYALTKTLNDMGYDCEQISYDYQKRNKKKKHTFVFKKIPQYVKYIIRMIQTKCHKKEYEEILESRRESMDAFNIGYIKHSNEVFDDNNIANASNYDVYITGSDQVWNLNNYKQPFFLTFAPKDKIKMSYAASLSMSCLDKEQTDILRMHLQDFDFISTREEMDVDKIKGICKKDVLSTLDPTLLIDEKNWNSLSAYSKLRQTNYIFCYFLGNNQNARRISKNFSKSIGKRIIFIPCANGEFIKEDLTFGDEQIKDCSPIDFLYLIKNAEYVLTDSFHACIFSILFKRQFYVFDRDKAQNMNSRIISLLEIFNLKNRYCSGKYRSIKNDVYKLDECDFSRVEPVLQAKRDISVGYIRKSVNHKKGNE